MKKIILLISITVFSAILIMTVRASYERQLIKSGAMDLGIVPPYIGLAPLQDKTFKLGEEAAVGVFVNTAGEPTVQSRFVITYDPKVLSIQEDGIVNQGLYPVIDIESVSNGKVIFSLFGDVEAGFLPLELTTEKLVAILNFRIFKEVSDNTFVNLILDSSSDSSSMITTRPSPDKTPDNILKSQKGAIIRTN